MTQIMSYWDDTLKKYVEVSTTDPLPTTATGGGSGGAEEVEITSAGGAATTSAGNSDGTAGTDVGLVTNARGYGFNGTTWDRVRVQSGSTDGNAAADTGLLTSSRLEGFNGTTWDRIHATNGFEDGISSTNIGLLTTNLKYLYNGTTWDRERNNVGGPIFTSAVHTGTHSSPTQINYNHSGVILFINVTANPGGTETLGLNFHYVDPVSTLVTPTIATMSVQPAVNGTYSLILYPGTTTVENADQNKVYGLPCPRNWQLSVTHSGAGSWTYSVGYSYII